MAVYIEEVQRVAELARLEITADETARLADEMTGILAFADSIRELDTTDVPPTTHAVEITDVLRDDIVGLMLDRDTVLAQAPDAGEGCFIAPKIV